MPWPASVPCTSTSHQHPLLLHPHRTCVYPCTVTSNACAATAALTFLALAHNAMQLVAAPALLCASWSRKHCLHYCRPVPLPSRPALEFSPEETDYIDSQAEASEDDSDMEVEIPSPRPRARARPRIRARATPALASGKPLPYCTLDWACCCGDPSVAAAAGKLDLTCGPWVLV